MKRGHDEDPISSKRRKLTQEEVKTLIHAFEYHHQNIQMVFQDPYVKNIGLSEKALTTLHNKLNNEGVFQPLPSPDIALIHKIGDFVEESPRVPVYKLSPKPSPRIRSIFQVVDQDDVDESPEVAKQLDFGRSKVKSPPKAFPETPHRVRVARKHPLLSVSRAFKILAISLLFGTILAGIIDYRRGPLSRSTFLSFITTIGCFLISWLAFYLDRWYSRIRITFQNINLMNAVLFSVSIILDLTIWFVLYFPIWKTLPWILEEYKHQKGKVFGNLTAFIYGVGDLLSQSWSASNIPILILLAVINLMAFRQFQVIWIESDKIYLEEMETMTK